MTKDILPTVADPPLFDDKPIWHKASHQPCKKPKQPKYPPDKDIDRWLSHNAPTSFEQLVDIRYVLYHKCNRFPFLVTAKNDDQFTLTGRTWSVRIVSDSARHYLLWKLRLLGKEKGWRRALPRTKKSKAAGTAENKLTKSWRLR